MNKTTAAVSAADLDFSISSALKERRYRLESQAFSAAPLRQGWDEFVSILLLISKVLIYELQDSLSRIARRVRPCQLQGTLAEEL